MAIKVRSVNRCLCALLQVTAILSFPNLPLELKDDAEVSASKCRSALSKGDGAGTSVCPPIHLIVF